MKLRILTPMYGGQCNSNYFAAQITAQKMLGEAGIHCNLNILEQESLISRARNKLVHLFMNSDDTHCLFWDADIGVNMDDLKLMLYWGQKPEYKVLAGLYAKKGIIWENVRQALLKNPQLNNDELEMIGADYAINTLDGQLTGKMGEPIEVLEAGTGLMLIERSVFEQMQEKYSDAWYLPIDGDNPLTTPDNEKAKQKMWAYFDSGVYEAYGTQAYLSEDYAFSARYRAIGGKVWLAPWTRTSHKGAYEFRADLRTRLRIGKGVANELHAGR